MLLDYFLSYHQFIHLLCRVAINCEKFTDTLVKLSMCQTDVVPPADAFRVTAMLSLFPSGVLIAYEGLPLHLSLFPKLWTELCQSSVRHSRCSRRLDSKTCANKDSRFLLIFKSAMAKTCVKLLCEDPAFSEYIKCILMDERTFLNNNVAYSFLTCFMHKVTTQNSDDPRGKLLHTEPTGTLLCFL